MSAWILLVLKRIYNLFPNNARRLLIKNLRFPSEPKPNVGALIERALSFNVDFPSRLPGSFEIIDFFHDRSCENSF